MCNYFAFNEPLRPNSQKEHQSEKNISNTFLCLYRPDWTDTLLVDVNEWHGIVCQKIDPAGVGANLHGIIFQRYLSQEHGTRLLFSSNFCVSSISQLFKDHLQQFSINTQHQTMLIYLNENSKYLNLKHFM